MIDLGKRDLRDLPFSCGSTGRHVDVDGDHWLEEARKCELSPGATAGIAVGTAAGVRGLVAVIAFVCVRKGGTRKDYDALGTEERHCVSKSKSIRHCGRWFASRSKSCSRNGLHFTPLPHEYRSKFLFSSGAIIPCAIRNCESSRPRSGAATWAPNIGRQCTSKNERRNSAFCDSSSQSML